MRRSRVIAETVNPDGRIVLMERDSWDHVVERHPAMAECLAETMSVIKYPDHREPDPRAGRERYCVLALVTEDDQHR